MTYFPQIGANGMMAQLPFVQTFSHLTSVSELPDGPRQAYAWRPAPLMAWDLTYSALTPGEYAALLAFFVSQQGRYGEFTFLDPGGNLVVASESFSDPSWTATGIALTAAQTDPYCGLLATSCVAAAAGKLAATVVPAGALSGFWLCGSVWVKPATSTTVTIALVDSAAAVQCSTNQTLAAGVWTRIATSGIMTSASPLSLAISWSSATVFLFGAQVAPTGGPGAYQRTPGNYGLHAKTRFDADVLAPQYVGPSQIAVKLRLVEHA
jgi:hypothetical protein